MPRLKVFTGESYAPTVFELPAQGRVVCGRSAEADLVLQIDRMARRHFALEREGDGWKVSDWGSTNGTAVNGELIQTRRLEDGDVISVVDLAFCFEERDEQRNPELEAAVAARPSSSEAVQVWADWLLERGDPLGEHLAQAMAGTDEDDPRWSGSLGGKRASWHCRVGWSDGLIESVELRAGRYPARPRVLLGQLFHLRAARFLRHLKVDFAGLSGAARPDFAGELTAMAPHLPATLRTLDLGYSLEVGDVVAPPAIGARFPQLAQAKVLRRVRAELVLPDGARHPLTRLASLGSESEWRFTVPANPTQWPAQREVRVEPHHGRWELRAAYSVLPPDHPRGLVRVNDVPDYSGVLFDGDEIRSGGQALKFELFPA